MIERDDVVIIFKYDNLNDDNQKILRSRVSATRFNSTKKRLNDFNRLINRKRKKKT